MTLIAKVFAELGPWNWWIAGLLLLGLEILAPGSVFLWFGVSAILVGTLALFVSLSWQTAVVIFLVLSFVTLFTGRRLMARLASERGDPGLNKRGSRYVGRTFVLDEPIEQGTGRLSIDDTVWRVSGPDLPAGARVRVDAVEGVRLAVSAV
ncbi:NfeD family protein [Roseibium litorale]|uniref:NfeD family protein n=1 Tax=Roseibium litorale TaxID=2803841 RepID=A0ABR9CSF7_9HYPH|nr:NfeD family protein [Roseibium litorale]MBD8893813.1 NfeD family protein [Roseibium litorale]